MNDLTNRSYGSTVSCLPPHPAVAYSFSLDLMRTLDRHTWHVMDAMADDWESIAQIHPDVERFCGATPKERIFDTLRSLHADGLVRVMEVGGHSNTTFPPPETRDTAWFCMIDVGEALWDSQGAVYRDEPI